MENDWIEHLKYKKWMEDKEEYLIKENEELKEKYNELLKQNENNQKSLLERIFSKNKKD